MFLNALINYCEIVSGKHRMDNLLEPGVKY